MFSAFALIGGGFTKILGKITFKGVMIFLAIVVVLLCGWGTYNWIFDRGAKSRDVEVTTLTGQKDKAVADYEKYKGEYEEWVRTTKNAKEQFIREQAATIEQLQTDLAKARESSSKKEVIYRDVTKYIPAQIGDTTFMPVGFVRLWNDTLEGSGSGEASPGNGISFGTFGPDGAASSVTLSEFSKVAGWNNDEAVQRGVIIRSWQKWYTDTKHQFTEAQRKAAEAIPRVPEEQATPSPAPQ